MKKGWILILMLLGYGVEAIAMGNTAPTTTSATTTTIIESHIRPMTVKVRNQIIVKYKDGVTKEDKSKFYDAFGLKVYLSDLSDDGDEEMLTITAIKSDKEMIQLVIKDPIVEYARTYSEYAESYSNEDNSEEVMPPDEKDVEPPPTREILHDHIAVLFKDRATEKDKLKFYNTFKLRKYENMSYLHVFEVLQILENKSEQETIKLVENDPTIDDVGLVYVEDLNKDRPPKDDDIVQNKIFVVYKDGTTEEDKEKLRRVFHLELDILTPPYPPNREVLFILDGTDPKRMADLLKREPIIKITGLDLKSLKSEIMPGKVIVTFKDGTPKEEKERVRKAFKLKKDKKDANPLFPDTEELTITDGKSEEDTARFIKSANDPVVKYAEPKYIMKIQATPSDASLLTPEHFQK